jgi:hypothetical protein
MRDPSPPSKPTPLGEVVSNSEKDKNKFIPKRRAPEENSSKVVTDKDGKMRTEIPENEGH